MPRPSASSVPLAPPVTWAHAARMFQRAAPDELGFGVTIFTPGLTMSSQPLMPSGLPGRTASTTTDFETMPLLAPGVPVRRHEPLVDEAGDVALEGEVDVVGRLPVGDVARSGHPTRRRTSGR